MGFILTILNHNQLKLCKTQPKIKFIKLKCLGMVGPIENGSQYIILLCILCILLMSVPVLQEKDGVSRTTVDDTIEDVIRGTRSGGRRMTRASATCAASAVATQALETRKSPRRKQCSAPPLPALDTPAAEVKSVVTPVEPAAPAKPLTPPTALHTPAQPPSTEPMTLIDPVTGLLIPMRESEEGQYIPVNTDHVR